MALKSFCGISGFLSPLDPKVKYRKIATLLVSIACTVIFIFNLFFSLLLPSHMFLKVLYFLGDFALRFVQD